MRRWFLRVPVLLLASCQGLPEDHELYSWFGDSAARMKNIIHAPQNEFDHSMRRLNRMPGGIERFANHEISRTTSLPNGARRFINREVDLAGSLPRNLISKAESGFRRASHGANALTNPDKLLLTPNGWKANLNKRTQSLKNPIKALDLDRAILPDPADEDQVTTVDSPLRKPSLLERILKRIRL